MPGSALLTHWQDFAAVCSELSVLVTEESSAAGRLGQMGLWGWGRLGWVEGDALSSSPVSTTWRGGGLLQWGLGMGASRVAMVTLAASSGRQELHWCSPASGVPHLPSWLSSQGSAGLVPSFWGGTLGSEQGDCASKLSQSKANPQLQPVALRVCGGPPSHRKVTPLLLQHVWPLNQWGCGLQG